MMQLRSYHVSYLPEVPVCLLSTAAVTFRFNNTGPSETGDGYLITYGTVMYKYVLF